jgi:hypothetical protein
MTMTTHPPPAQRPRRPAGAIGSAPPPGHEAELGRIRLAEVTRLYAMLEVAFLAPPPTARSTTPGRQPQRDAVGLARHQAAGETVEHVIERFIASYGADGREARLAAIAGVLDDASRRLAYTLACLVVLCDLELHDHELDVLGVIATGLELTQDEAQATFEAIQDHVETVVANARA